MKPDQWRELVIEEVRKISDSKYQEESWLGAGERISSPVELYCTLFDDLIFDEFFASETVALDEKQRAAGVALRGALEEYSKSMPEAPDPYQVIKDPRWEQVRAIASEFVSCMTV